MTGTILVDVDGTLGAHLPHLLEIAAANGIDHDAVYEDIRGWNADVPGTAYDVGDLIEYATTEHTEEYLGEMPPIENARSALSALRDAGWTVVICTHRPAHHHAMTASWLKQNEIPHDAYAYDVPENKALVGGDVLIDDYHVNVAAAAEHGLKTFLFQSPYSVVEEVENYSDATVVESWNAVVDHLLNDTASQQRSR